MEHSLTDEELHRAIELLNKDKEAKREEEEFDNKLKRYDRHSKKKSLMLLQWLGLPEDMSVSLVGFTFKNTWIHSESIEVNSEMDAYFWSPGFKRRHGI